VPRVAPGARLLLVLLLLLPLLVVLE